MINCSTLQVYAAFATDPADGTQLVNAGFEVWNGGHFIAYCSSVGAANGILLAICGKALETLLANAAIGNVLIVDRQNLKIDLYPDSERPALERDTAYARELWTVDVIITEHKQDPGRGTVHGYDFISHSANERSRIMAAPQSALSNLFSVYLGEFLTADEPFHSPLEPSNRIVPTEPLAPKVI